MTLLVDAGNTRVKIAHLDSKGRLEPIYIGDLVSLTEADLPAQKQDVWLSCVGNDDKVNQLQAHFEQWQLRTHVVRTEAQAFGVQNAYRDFHTLGVDRWLGLIAAHNEQPANTVIIDAGTAITVDWLDSQGQHQGGWIVPGVDLMVSALTARSDRLFIHSDDFGRANHLGQSTPEGIKDGCVNAFVGIIKQAISITETELDWSDYRLLLTGGSYPLLPPDIKRRGEQRPELVLQGLAYYAAGAAAP